MEKYLENRTKTIELNSRGSFDHTKSTDEDSSDIEESEDAN